jgi:hypothetical protein
MGNLTRCIGSHDYRYGKGRLRRLRKNYLSHALQQSEIFTHKITHVAWHTPRRLRW